MTSQSQKHFPALDGLRGLAALMIVAHHSAVSYVLTNTVDKAYLRLTSWLWVGVDLFFVLSGFLITTILLDTRHSRNFFRTFYGRRIVRIFPLYYAYLVVLYFVIPLLGAPLTESLVRNKFWVWTYTQNIYNCFHPWLNVNTNHFWTLAIEEQFYCLWPLFVFFLGGRKLKKWSIALLLLLPLVRWGCLAVGLSTRFTYNFTLCHSDGLVLGGLIAILLREGFIERRVLGRSVSTMPVVDWAVAGLTIAFFGVYYFVLGNHEFVFNMAGWPTLGQCVGGTFIALYFGYIVFRSVTPGINHLQRTLNWRPFRAIGRYSYALYVLHAPICYWVGASFPVPIFLDNLPPQWSFAHSLYLILVEFTLSIAAAVVSWHLLEKHFLKLKKYFPYRAMPEPVSGYIAPVAIAESA